MTPAPRKPGHDDAQQQRGLTDMKDVGVPRRVARPLAGLDWRAELATACRWAAPWVIASLVVLALYVGLHALQ
ncbi:hypothetical protein WS67_01205 [Burkholderia singularis]|uniref:Uncharacterized protein n=1 Tax=Burkholderia singularis TaxID=1503053 RepID=A0A103DWX6_9BURK|nr:MULTISPECIES: hypothetical protein [Burkholderia]AOK29059.1 hypothetical protein AQ611_06085 [Burkholderia sp. Bp7605]KVE24210.1 hypothetical protein WS67_01205 [Burkholderia singularis]SMG02476.1 hypothetical protein BSIN_5126 [Burkholderia singularis]